MNETCNRPNALTGINWIDEHPLFLAVGASLPAEAPPVDALDEHELFDELDTEMMKRGTLSHSAIRWDWVCEQSAGLLQTQAKDLRLLLFILHSLPHIKNTADPLALAAVLLSRFIAIWGTLSGPAARYHPALARKIADALEQLANHTLQRGTPPQPVEITAQSLRQAAEFFKSLDEQAAAKLFILANRIEASTIEEDTSGLSSLEKIIKEPVQPKPVMEVKEADNGMTPVMELHPENLVLDSKNERALKQSLTVVADFLLGLEMANPLSYRLRRFATWYGIKDTPAQKREGDPRTIIMPVSRNALDEYRIAAERGQMDYDIAHKLERSCHLQPLWIEGQYLACKLAMMCERQQAAAAIHEDTSCFVTRTPWLLKLQFSDGSPFVSDDVQTWLDSYKKAAAPVALSQENEMIGGEMQALVRSAREKAAQGQTHAAIRILEQSRPAADSPRSRSLWEMLMLECLSDWGMKNLVSSQAVRLENAISDIPVKAFEPELLNRIRQLALKQE